MLNNFCFYVQFHFVGGLFNIGDTITRGSGETNFEITLDSEDQVIEISSVDTKRCQLIHNRSDYLRSTYVTSSQIT